MIAIETAPRDRQTNSLNNIGDVVPALGSFPIGGAQIVAVAGGAYVRQAACHRLLASCIDHHRIDIGSSEMVPLRHGED